MRVPFFTFLACAVLLSTAAGAEEPRPLEAVSAEVAALAARGEFSGAILATRGGEVLLRAAYGQAEPGRPNTPDTRFNLGSIDKGFTRLAIEQLAAAGKLALTDRLDRWVPEYPAEKGGKISLEQLLQHTAGTGDVFGPRYDAADKSKLRELADWLPLFADEPLRFEPGAGKSYSNAGYVLLGLVVEKASGRSYYDYVREHIFEPAGMKDTGSVARGGEATGFTGPDRRSNRDRLPARSSSAGGGYSTLGDLARFAAALRAGELGPAVRQYGIAGGGDGINALLRLEGDVTLVVLSNLDPPAAQTVAERVAAAVGLAPASGPGAGPRLVRRTAAAGDEALRPRATSVPEAGAAVPMLRRRHLPAVQVTIDGQGPFVFAVDTGASGTARIRPALAERLKLEKTGEVQAGDPSGQNMRALPLYRLPSVELGGARFQGVQAAAREFPQVPGATDLDYDGILGFGLFADCLLTLDYAKAEVRLQRGELPAADGREVLAYQDERGVPVVKVAVGGKEFLADLDTGAQGGISLPAAEAPSLPLATSLRTVGRARTAHNEFEVQAADLDGDLKLGAVTLSRPQVEFQPIFPMANLGARVLEKLSLTFDQKNKRVRLVSAPAAQVQKTTTPL